MSYQQPEKLPRWRGLRFLALGWTILPLTLMLVLAVGAIGVALQTTVQSLVEAQQLTLTRQLAARFSETLDGYALSLQILAQQPNMADLDPGQIADTFEAYNYLLTDFVNGGGLVILNEAGRIVATWPHRPELAGQDYSQQPYFLNLKNTSNRQPVFFDVLPEPGSGRQMVGLAYPIVDEANKFAGAIIGRFYLDLQQLGRIIRPLQDEDGSLAYLVDRNGAVIFHSDNQMIGSSFSGRPAVLDLRQTGQAGATVIQSADVGKEIVGYAPVDPAGWGVVISKPWTQVARPVQKSLIFSVAFLTLGLLGLLLVVLWVVQRIIQRLHYLVEQTRHVAAGAYDSEVELSRISEIRELGIAFNHMVSHISSYRDGLQEYVASVTDSQEEERKRIARDLHDGTVQTLIAIGQRIELVRDALEEQPVAESKAQLTELRIMVTEGIASVRQFSQNLRPLALEDLGLVPALQHLVGRLEQRYGISARLRIEGDAAGLSPDLEVAIFRIVQETLNNIVKHAQATQVMVTVRFLPRQTILEVQDNGVGFEVPQNTTDLARYGSFGLLGLEERANLFGGDISIQSAIDEGTIVRVILPHKQPPRRREVRSQVDHN